MPLFTYDVSKVLVTVAFPAYVGPVEGLSEGTFVRVQRNAPTFRMVPGTEGQVTSVKTEREDGYVDLVLEDASPFNAFLTALYIQDDLTQLGVGVVQVKNNRSVFDLAIGYEARCVGPPPFVRGSEAGQTSWRFDAGRVAILHGGAVPAEDPSRTLSFNPFDPPQNPF